MTEREIIEALKAELEKLNPSAKLNFSFSDRVVSVERIIKSCNELLNPASVEYISPRQIEDRLRSLELSFPMVLTVAEIVRDKEYLLKKGAFL